MYMINTITCADCLEVFPDVLTHSVDMILCDLPYGSTAPKWDERIDMVKLWDHCSRVIKPSGTIALFSSQPFTTKLISSNEKQFRYCWYWIKNQATNFFHASRMPTRKVEEICIFGNGVYNPQMSTGHVPTNSAKGCSSGKTYHGSNKRDYAGGSTSRYPTNVLDFKCVDNYSRIHSAQKPVKLCEYLIKTYSNEGDLVLDNCAGSCTTAVACLNTKRDFIAIEVSQDYCDVGMQRISQHSL